MTDYASFFNGATGLERPYPYQAQLAEQPWPDLLDVPTGLGKTAAVTLAWLYKRGWRLDRHREAAALNSDTPRRLVWCLPMRVLVEQTHRNICNWLSRLGIAGELGDGKVSVHLLMGGESDVNSWIEHPEEDMILIGTQDMLLSRALMRGYGMSRYQWPMHFSLLHNDCLWAFDEVQLMGAGLATSAQLEAFRRRFSLAKSSKTLWLSATLNPQWLATVDMQPHIADLNSLKLTEADKTQAGERFSAIKRLSIAPFSADSKIGNKEGLAAYLEQFIQHLLAVHQSKGQTLVIVNRVDRAQKLFQAIKKIRPDQKDLLIHARFRLAERQKLQSALTEEPSENRILVATQAIEAGVDLSSKVLISELAPWSSMVQRFGRANRYGEYNNENGAEIYWVDFDSDISAKDLAPYSEEELATARAKLTELTSASSADLPTTRNERSPSAILRKKDLLDLFNTDADLSGFDVDIADYIRDNGTPQLQVFWRDFTDPNQPEVQTKPSRNELCSVPISQSKTIEKLEPWIWDSLTAKWQKLPKHSSLHPGMTLLISAKNGGYDPQLGFLDSKAPVDALADTHLTDIPESYQADGLSEKAYPIELTQHLGNVAQQAESLCANLTETQFSGPVIRAARWHDVGKAHCVFQETLHRYPSAPPSVLAKSPSKAKHSRPHFRHELASTLAWLAQHDDLDYPSLETDLIAYLIAAHHGKVRLSLRAMPNEKPEPNNQRFARGIWEGDRLPELQFDNEISQETELKLAIMELGQGEQGASWSARTSRLLDHFGPFLLAWLETLVRIADWRASKQEQVLAKASGDNQQEQPYDLARQNSAMAELEPGTPIPDQTGEFATQSGEQHGIRGRTSKSEDTRDGTRTPDHATREIETALGILSYAQLAEHLAIRVEKVAFSISRGDFDAFPLDERLILAFHKQICGDLTPRFAGQWRTTEVVVGTHQPPQAWQISQKMRDYVRDLEIRIDHLLSVPDETLLETLAFAEGRLLSIHPFQDFNGRTTRLFIEWLLRRLNLPDLDPIPSFGQPADDYLAALRAGDQVNWEPLAAIWKQRLEGSISE